MGGLLDFLRFGKNTAAGITAPVADPSPNERQYDSSFGMAGHVPEKTFIERDGPGVDYWFDPTSNDILDILYGKHAHENLIELFYCLPEFASAVHQIASRVSDATWLLKKQSDDETDWKNDQFNRLFDQPNPFMSMRQHVYQACCYYLLTGKQYFNINSGVLDSSLENVATWGNLPANYTTVWIKKGVDRYTVTSLDELIEKYTVPQNGKNREFKTDNVLPLVNFSLLGGNDINCPVSIFKGAEKAIANLLAVYEARHVIYIKKGPLGLLVSRKQPDEGGSSALTAKEKKDTQRELQRSYGLSRDKSQIMMISNPMDFVSVGSNIKDLMPFDETEQSCIELFSTASIPRHLAPTKSASTFANGETDMKDFYAGVIQPIANMFAQIWTTGFKLRSSSDIRNRRYIVADYSHVPFLQDDQNKKAVTDKSIGEMYEKRFYNSVCTLNDWIVATGERKRSDAIYGKTLLEMTPEEVERIRLILNIKSPITSTTNDSTGNNQAESGKNDSGSKVKSIAA